MTHNEYENLKPREAVSTAESRLFSFTRIRAGEVRRFFPGSGAKIHIANRDVDTLTIPGVPSGYLAPGDVVTASYRGKTVFRGDVSQIVESMSRGTDKTQTVTCVGPWSKMQRLVYRQEWFTGGGYSYSSRLILNQTKSGRPQNLNSELYEIAAHGANACGYDVNIADIAVSSQILPMDECRDITVADAIKRELRFFPKAMCYFDYSKDKPSLIIKKPTSTVSATYVDTIPKSAREYVYNAHPITGVDLEIEATGSIEGVNYHQIAHQTAGDTTAGNPDCLYATLQIKGASAQSTHQTFKSVTEDIPKDLFDAVEIDGGKVWHQIWHIVPPMSMPIIGTLAILKIIGSWNNFVGPLLYIRDSNRQTLAVALLHLEGEYTRNWGELMAGYTIASLPLIVLFLFCMRLFVKGLTAGAVKG